ncbi:MAG: tRNA lysidine(34) synthetase TilS [Phycisphaerae bacterium]|nr:tRNA lysidine(34) synthetase TilS [Phycisphaerae bacterium]
MADTTNIPDDFRRRLTGAIDAGNLLRPSARVLVGVSGGVDSVVLLHALAEIAKLPGREYSLIVAHLDHRLRDAAGEDAAFVEHLADTMHLPYVLERIDVRVVAQEQKQGVEHAARMARYEFLARAAKEHDASAVAVAHHADDNVETILFRILRGTALRGLRGMEAVRELRTRASQRSAASQSSIVDCGLRNLSSIHNPYGTGPQSLWDRSAIHNFTLVRPLLGFRREEILAYARATKLAWREDHTNDETRYRRNFLRHELLPLMREVNDKADEALLRLGELARQAEAFVARQAQRRLAEAICHEESRRILLDVTMFAPDPADETETILRTTAYRMILERLGMPQRDLSAEHLADIDALLHVKNGVVNLPADFTARRERNHLLFEKI